MRGAVIVCCVLVAAALLGPMAVAQGEPASAANGETVAAPVPAEAVPAAPASEPQMLTLQDMLEAGGAILWVIMILGFFTLAMGIFLFLTVTQKRETSEVLFKRLVAQIRSGDMRGAFQMCEGRSELLPRVVYAGLKVHGHGRYVVQEAMESEGERAATALWQRISYLNNVGVIAPLLGLLGTVWGMIGAFGAIAMEDAQVKGLTMALKVSQAMITTAAGLILAIPAMMAYFYLRGRVVKIVAEVEGQASEIVELLSRGERE